MKRYIFVFAVLALLMLSACATVEKKAEQPAAGDVKETADISGDNDNKIDTDAKPASNDTAESNEKGILPSSELTSQTPIEDNKCGVTSHLTYVKCVKVGSENKIEISVWNSGRGDISSLWTKAIMNDNSEKVKPMEIFMKSSPDKPVVIKFEIDLSEYASKMSDISKFYIFPEYIKDDKVYYCFNQKIGFSPDINCKTGAISLDKTE